MDNQVRLLLMERKIHLVMSSPPWSSFISIMSSDETLSEPEDIESMPGDLSHTNNN